MVKNFFLNKYFNSRNKSLEKDKNIREVLGHREILTLNFLIKNFYNHKLNNNLNILDLGSGDKFLKKPIEENCNKYFNLDIEDLDFERDNFKFESEKFDLVICLAVIEHISDPSIFLNEVYRVLKRGGYFYLSTPNWVFSKNEFYDDPTHKKPYTPVSLKNTLDMHGFIKTKTFPNLRCKSKWWYSGNSRFLKANYLLPLKSKKWFLPKFLTGRAKGIFAITKK